MKKKIVLMESSYQTECVRFIDENFSVQWYLDDNYIQLSEVIEVKFPELPKEAVVNNQVAVIDRKIQSVMAESEAKITQLKARKQELLAISYEPEKDDGRW